MEQTLKKAPTLVSYQNKIIRAMKASGTYDANLFFQIKNLARSLRILDMVDIAMSSPEFTLVTMKVTRDGEQPIENPLIKTMDRAQNQVNRQMKQLKLTVEDLIGAPELPDAIDELTEELEKIR